MLAIFLDTETNGLNPYKHKVLELALKIVDVETGEELATFSSFCAISAEDWKKSDPESLKVNGITWDKTTGGKTKEAIAEELTTLFTTFSVARNNAVFICQNPSFDRPFFSQIIPTEIQEKMVLPYHWLDLASMFWAKRMEQTETLPPWKSGLSKDKIAAALSLPPEEKPHQAINGVNHLILCYQHIVGFPCQ